MPSIISRPPPSHPRPIRRPTRPASRRERRRPEADHNRRKHSSPPEQDAGGRYTDWTGRRREVVARRGVGGSVLVIDRDATTLDDRRLVAHIASDEPPGERGDRVSLFHEAGPT